MNFKKVADKFKTTYDWETLAIQSAGGGTALEGYSVVWIMRIK